MRLVFVFVLTILFLSCSHAQSREAVTLSKPEQKHVITVGAESFDEYFPLLSGKRIGILTNHTGMVDEEHLVDLLHQKGFDVQVIFAPEHGFRGNADAGEKVDDELDEKTGIPVHSLYKSKTGRPDDKTMQGLDILLFDLQDVGLRYYTYYISMYRLMEACSDNQKPLIVLDRPNPNGFYIDGPILDMKHKSGVGYLPIPIVHGMTLGELALMINGEGWLPQKKTCQLTVIPCHNYTHDTKYELPVPPSPNLPNMKSVYLYASTCFFEGTPVSLGRGTAFPFQTFGHPGMKGKYSFSFTPQSIPGAKNPPLLNQVCYGIDLRELPDEEIWKAGINLNYLIEAYRTLNIGDKFFTSFFEKLTGVDYVRKMIIEGKTNEEIKAMWREDVERFREQRRPYLIYPE